MQSQAESPASLAVQCMHKCTLEQHLLQGERSCLYPVWISAEQILEEIFCSVEIPKMVLRRRRLHDDPVTQGKIGLQSLQVGRKYLQRALLT